MTRLAVIFLSHLLLWFLVGGLNHAIAGWQIQLFAGGLFVTYPALRMERTEGLLASLLAGLVVDAASPLPFGLTALLFGIAHTLMLQLRPRLAISEAPLQAVVAILAGVVLYLAKSAALARGLPAVSGIWGRMLWELFLSSVLTGLAAPWFFALQDRCLQLAQAPLLRRPPAGDDHR